MRINSKLFTLFIAAAALTACQMEPATFFFEQPSALSASATYVTDTKAALVTAVPNTFSLYACSYSSTPTGVNYIYGETMTKSDSKWVSENKFARVPSDKTVKYFAVHPSNATGLILPAADAAGSPVFGYTLPEDASNQSDIIIASHDYSGSQENITLSFGHILAAVDFKFSADGAFDGTIKSISVTGVNTKGSYTLGTGWNNLSTTGTVTQTVNKAVTSSMGGAAITTTSNAMTLIPQTAGSGAMLQMVINDGAKDITLECSLSGQSFVAGKDYTISLDLSGAFSRKVVIEGADVTDWVNAAMGKAPTKKAESVFTVDDNGTQVRFSPGNLYKTSSRFDFEEYQYKYPTTWLVGHVGFFYWSNKSNDATNYSYSGSSSASTSDKFFAVDGGAVEGYTVLSRDEWDYVISNALAKNSSGGNTITIAENNCVVLKPDGFSGTVADSYTAEQWAQAESDFGLVALPFAGFQSNKTSMPQTKAKPMNRTGYNQNTNVTYLSSSPNESLPNYAYGVYFDSGSVYTDSFFRDVAHPVRLVSYVGISATYDVGSQTEATLPTATFSSGTVAAIDWGDGDIEVKARPSGGEVTLSHTYASAYMGKVKINVKEGKVTFISPLQKELDRLFVCETEKVTKEFVFIPQLINALFSVDGSGKKVKFAKGNLYWKSSSSEFRNEENQYDSHASSEGGERDLFFWSKDASVATAPYSYSDISISTSDKFFAADGGVVEGYTVLSRDEWAYVISNALARNSSGGTVITIAEKNCVVLKPDGFSGTVADSYSAEQWAQAESDFGLVALPLLGDYARDGSVLNKGNLCQYWASTLDSDDPDGVYIVKFSKTSASVMAYTRSYKNSVRLVQVQ